MIHLTIKCLLIDFSLRKCWVNYWEKKKNTESNPHTTREQFCVPPRLSVSRVVGAKPPQSSHSFIPSLHKPRHPWTTVGLELHALYHGRQFRVCGGTGRWVPEVVRVGQGPDERQPLHIGSVQALWVATRGPRPGSPRLPLPNQDSNSGTGIDGSWLSLASCPPHRVRGVICPNL